MQKSPLLSQRALLAKQRVYLRNVLREHPTWVMGHARLGETELHLELLRDGPKDPRALGAVRTSAAAVRLLDPYSGTGEKNRVQLEADYLEAMLRYLAKDYSAAVETFESLLVPASASHLPERMYWSVLEHAGAALMVLGNDVKAKACFERIPVRARSGAQASAMRYLNLSAEERAHGAGPKPAGGCVR
ncbi:MAG: hypothetical protein U0136_00055 [Bdellovibrionota bacterium]